MYKLDWDNGRIISRVDGVTKTRNIELKCARCGNKWDLVVDHIIPRPYGKDNIENLQVLCSTCNTRKGYKEDKEYRMRQIKLQSLRVDLRDLLFDIKHNEHIDFFLDEIRKYLQEFTKADINDALNTVKEQYNFNRIEINKLLKLLNLEKL